MANSTDEVEDVKQEEQFSSDDDVETDMNRVLISLVQRSPLLYDNKHSQYNDRVMLDQTWTKIGAELGITGDDAKEKWQKLRNNYGKALERRRRKPTSGCTKASMKRRKPWTYESEMGFLRGYLKTYRPAATFSMRKLSPIQSGASLDEACHTDWSPTVAVSSSLASGPLSDSEVSEDTTTEPQVDKSLSGHSSITPVTLGQKLPAASADARPSDVDAAMMTYIQMLTKREHEDPAIGWFKTLLPMIKTLSPIGLLDFQSKVVLELKTILLKEEEQRHH